MGNRDIDFAILLALGECVLPVSTPLEPKLMAILPNHQYVLPVLPSKQYLEELTQAAIRDDASLSHV